MTTPPWYIIIIKLIQTLYLLNEQNICIGIHYTNTYIHNSRLGASYLSSYYYQCKMNDLFFCDFVFDIILRSICFDNRVIITLLIIINFYSLPSYRKLRVILNYVQYWHRHQHEQQSSELCQKCLAGEAK